MEIEGININWLGHSGFNIENKIVIDPFKIVVPIKVDIVLITHSHYDHCSIEDLQKVIKEDTTIIAPPDCTSKLSRIDKGNIKIIAPDQTIEIQGIKIQAVRAYNIDREFHPRQNDWCGYIITINNKTIYHAGDTDLIPEMNDIQVDIALLPVGGTYTMNAKEAAQAAKKVKAKYVIPMHYTKGIAGSKEDAEKLKELLPDEVIIMD